MRALVPLTIANFRSFLRDRGGMFWSLAFPVVFVLLFGFIFSAMGRDVTYPVGWVDEDQSSASAELRAVLGRVGPLHLSDMERAPALDAMQSGNERAVVVVPQGFGAQLQAAQSGGAALSGSPATLTLFTDPSQQSASATIEQIVTQVVGAMNQRMTSSPTIVAVKAEPIQGQSLSILDYFVPSVLAMALMQLGLFGAIPLVEQREKLILKRLGATPLRRWTLVASNVLVRLVLGLVQAVLILGIGTFAFGVHIVGNWLAVAFLVILGALMFVSLGYVVAAFARTEEAASAITSVLQFPLMFLSGIFFQFDLLPGFLKAVGALIPLTYLGDAMRQVMVQGTAFVPLPVDIAVLAAWLVGCFAVSARFFRWE
jgi:ABC-2 type transport system permease protein